jgi:hypothetical protein
MLSKIPIKSILLVTLFFVTPAFAQVAFPSGTIVAVQLNSSLNSRKVKPGQEITARVMQDVPLPLDKRLRAGSKLVGKIESVRLANHGGGAEISIRFDQLRLAQQTVPITVKLRALASMMAVEDAQVPATGPDRGTPWAWSTRNLIGGDVAYGQGGPVERRNQKVGTTLANGVLTPVRANPTAGCPAEPTDNTEPQAFWVFSSDACGVYGFDGVQIANPGSEPGAAVITSTQGDLDIRAGSALLFRTR